MDYILYGTDPRMQYLAALLQTGGHRVLSWEGIRGAHVTPIDSLLEVTAPVRLVLPLTSGRDLIEKALSTLPLGSRVYAGKCPEDEEVQSLLTRRGIRFHDLNSDEKYCRENAIPTAEGALHAFLEHTPKCLSESHVAVTGSGRVARAVVDLFLKNGVCVTVLARDKRARKAFRNQGCCTIALPPNEKKLARLLCDVDALINTIPVPGIVSDAILTHTKRAAPILELASGRENIDATAAERHLHPILFLPALPGKIAPQSAAKALYHAITKTEKEGIT